MARLLVRWFSLVVALFVAQALVPGIEVRGDAWGVFGAAAAILAVLNLLLRPILRLLACGLMALSLGLFGLVINGLVLWLASRIAVHWFHVGFQVRNFWAAFFGALIVSVVSTALTLLLTERRTTPDATRD